jgi:DNA-binding HxlR family transcriptional regulator
LTVPRKRPSDARVRNALDILGQRWNGAILHALVTGGELRFGELRSKVSGISDKLLSARLKDLETTGIVARRIDAARPPRALYRVTSKADGLAAVFAALAEWGGP